MIRAGMTPPLGERFIECQDAAEIWCNRGQLHVAPDRLGGIEGQRHDAIEVVARKREGAAGIKKVEMLLAVDFVKMVHDVPFGANLHPKHVAIGINALDR